MPSAPEVSPRPVRPLPAAAALSGLVVTALAGAVAAAAARSGVGTCVALAVAALAEVAVVMRFAALPELLHGTGAGRPTRTAVQLLAVVVLAGRADVAGSVFVGTAATAAVLVALAVAGQVARQAVERLRRPPLVTRNLDLPGVELPASPPAAAMHPRGADSLAGVVAAVGLTVAIHEGTVTAAAVGLAVATAAAAAPLLLLAPTLLALAKPGTRQRLTDAATKAVGALRPEVVVYFAATAEETYQVRMWLEPVARLGRRALVLVRGYDVFDALSDVQLPIAATSYNGTVAALPLASPAVALFVTHTGNNLSMLRRPEVRSVFVGHGDSDKPDSVNPFARVYDEVWVAGPLGRRRYAEADVGVADSAVVEVGRPQVVPVTPSGSVEPSSPAVVVYAPTWEGWGDDPHHGSLAHVGPALVARLAALPDVRVRYRPHPLTGRRSPALRAADGRIRQLVDAVPATEPLAQTLGAASGVIGDVSSVLTEFLPFDRPYAVVDTRGLGTSALARDYPTVAAAFVLGARLDELDEFLAVLRGAPDPTAATRRELLNDVLGDPATSQQRFAAAVARLLEERPRAR